MLFVWCYKASCKAICKTFNHVLTFLGCVDTHFVNVSVHTILVCLDTFCIKKSKNRPKYVVLLQKSSFCALPPLAETGMTYLALDKEIKKFKVDLQNTQTIYDRSSTTNLTSHQQRLTATLNTDNNVICIKGDKHVGGYLLRRDSCNHRGIREHLGDTNVYKLLTKRKAIHHLHTL